MSTYPHYIYFLQKQSLHFGLRTFEIFRSGCMETFLGQNIISQKLIKFTQILNYIKSSCITFCTKMVRYPHYMHFSEEKATHSGLMLLTNFVPEILGNFEQYQVFMHIFSVSKCLDILIIYIAYIKNHQILGQKIFELYEVFTCKNVPIVPYCILIMRTKSK